MPDIIKKRLRQVVHLGHTGYDYPVSVSDGQKTGRYIAPPRTAHFPRFKDDVKDKGV